MMFLFILLEACFSFVQTVVFVFRGGKMFEDFGVTSGNHPAGDRLNPYRSWSDWIKLVTRIHMDFVSVSACVLKSGKYFILQVLFPNVLVSSRQLHLSVLHSP